jgi:hypothetical protein
MRPIVIKEMRGLNTSRARLQLQPGEAGCLQNVRPNLTDNWGKRRGCETSAIRDDPVNGIYEWDFDEIVMPCVQVGDALQFFPPDISYTVTQGGQPVIVTPTPTPMPDPLDPTGTGTAAGISFGVEQAMRALQERVCRRGGSPLSWPDGTRDAEGNSVTTLCVTVPLSTFYGAASTATDLPQPGLYRYDCYYRSGYAATLVQSVVDAADAECGQWLAVYPEGQASLTTFTSSTFWGGTKPTATAANYRTVLAQAREAIRGLMFYSVGGSLTEAYEKSSGQSDTSCESAKALCLLMWPSSWSSAAVAEAQISEWTAPDGSPGIYDGLISRTRAKVTADLSAYKSANGACFLLASPKSGGFSNTSDCPVDADAKWHAWQGVTVGQVVTSDYINDNDAAPSFSSNCPIGGVTKGWTLTPSIILRFVFTYAA